MSKKTKAVDVKKVQIKDDKEKAKKPKRPGKPLAVKKSPVLLSAQKIADVAQTRLANQMNDD